MSAIAASTPARRNRVHRFFIGVAIGTTMFASLLAVPFIRTFLSSSTPMQFATWLGELIT